MTQCYDGLPSVSKILVHVHPRHPIDAIAYGWFILEILQNDENCGSIENNLWPYLRSISSWIRDQVPTMTAKMPDEGYLNEAPSIMPLGVTDEDTVIAHPASNPRALNCLIQCVTPWTLTLLLILTLTLTPN